MYSGSLGTVSNRETWEQSITVLDDNGDSYDISTAAIVIAVRRRGENSAALTASVGSGIVVSSPSFTFTFSVASMRELEPGMYDVGCTILINGLTTQLIVGTATIIDGVVA